MHTLTITGRTHGLVRVTEKLTFKFEDFNELLKFAETCMRNGYVIEMSKSE